MVLKKEYFSTEAGSPAPLTATTTRRIRFEEVDLLRMVWHGRYPGLFEEGRTAFADSYGLSTREFMDNQIAAPVFKLHIDYQQPLRLDEIVTITTTLYWSEALRLNFTYRIFDNAGVQTTSAYTIQLLTDLQGNLLLLPPDMITSFRKWWRNYL